MSTHRYPGGVISATPPTASASTAVGVWTLEEALRNKAAGNWPDGSGADPYFNYTTLLLHGDGTNGAQNNTFLDSSTNNFTITRNGNPTQGSFDPYVGPGNWSIYFNGTTDYLTSTSTSIVPTGTESFTIEMWFYKGNAWNAVNQLLFFGAPTGVQIWVDAATTSLKLSYNSALILSYSTSTLSINTWYHLAIARNGSAIAMYINGSQVASGTDSTSIPAPTSVIIGNYNTGTTNVWNGYISNLRIVRGVALYTSAFTTPTTPLVSTTQTTLLNCNNNGFNDLSGGNISFTRSGTPQVSKFSPFTLYQTTPASYSGYLDGTGDYLNTASSAVFAFGTGDFTIECWFYLTSLGTYRRIWWFSDDNDNTDVNASNQVEFGGASQTAITGSTISAGTWYHLAYVRSSGSGKLFLNGTQVGSTTANSYSSSSRSIYIGATNTGANPWIGSISNLRVTKGQALYTTTFTPSTTPLTTTSQGATAANVSLLTCQSTTFIDNSTNALTITANGNATPKVANPFTDTVSGPTAYSTTTYGGSAYFDGTGDYLSLGTAANLNFGTSNFTIEFWYFPNTIPSGNTTIISNGNAAWGAGAITILGGTGSTSSTGMRLGAYDFSTSTSIVFDNAATVLNQWTHYAFTRSGNNFALYRNGALVSTNTWTGSVNLNNNNATKIGGGSWDNASVNGYVANLRVVNGTAVYTGPFVPPAAPVTAVTNTQLLFNATNGGIFDNTTVNDLETVGNAQISTSVVKYGTGSIAFDGSGDYLVPSSAGSNNALAFGTGDFTVEMWVYPTSFTGQTNVNTLIDWRPASTNGAYLTLYLALTTGYLTLYVNSAAVISTTSAPTLNTWSHVAVTRSSGSTKIFLNGTQVGSTWTDSTNYLATASRPLIGTSGNFVTSDYFTGYLDDIRITKGYARYTANFTPPTAAFPNT